MLILIIILLIIFAIWLVGHFVLRSLGYQIQWPWFSHVGQRFHATDFYRNFRFNWQNEEPSRIPKQVVITFIVFMIVIGVICYISMIIADY